MEPHASSSLLASDRLVQNQFTAYNAVTYLLYCFLSIAFLVFLSATQPFVITDVLGNKSHVGDDVGQLAFADELLSIFLCPLWGALSDIIGTRPVAVIAFIISGLAITIYTSASNVYPELLLHRLFFAIGGSATTAMITAMLAEISSSGRKFFSNGYGSVSSDSSGTVTKKNGRISAIVGLCSGFGAIAAVSLLVPLPTWLGPNTSETLPKSYKITGVFQIFTAFVLLAGLYANKNKRLRTWLRGDSSTQTPYVDLIKQGFTEAYHDPILRVSYFGGFVARSASVGIALFLPLWVNLWFYQTKRCHLNIHDPNSKIKSSCHEAYIRTAILTGIANLSGLIFAPIWGYLADSKGQWPTIAISGTMGLIGCLSLMLLESPESSPAFISACLIGGGQIGAIITSMSLCTTIKRPNSGSIGGAYSLFGGLGILFISKLGGYFSDRYSASAFLILGIFFIIYISAAGYYRRLIKEI